MILEQIYNIGSELENSWILIVEELVLIAFSMFYTRKLKSYRPKVTHAFYSGLGIGIASVLWPWAAIAIVIQLVIAFIVLRVYTKQLFWNIIFGFMMPIMLYSPYALYKVIVEFRNTGTLELLWLRH